MRIAGINFFEQYGLGRYTSYFVDDVLGNLREVSLLACSFCHAVNLPSMTGSVNDKNLFLWLKLHHYHIEPIEAGMANQDGRNKRRDLIERERVFWRPFL